MRAAVIHEPGAADVLKIEERPIPTPAPGEVLIEVRAFGLNRSELFTRRGLSPGVAFPRVLGIEATGIVKAAPGGEFAAGETVATAMGGMGRAFDGGYAEYVVAPASQVQRLSTTLPWAVLGALPEMLQTAWGSVSTALGLRSGETLLIRGGTTSIGLAAAAIAKRQGATVLATSRDAGRAEMLHAAGADQAIVDDGAIAAAIRKISPTGVDKVLELIGTTTLVDSLACARRGGRVCMTGMVGDRWTLDDFAPMEAIPTAVNLTTYSGGADDFMATPLQDLVHAVERGDLKVKLGPTFRLDEIVAAHRCMEENRAAGKIVVLP
jgi:NADPH:quinone reductase-like Zn-dependent oxidoreductase